MASNKKINVPISSMSSDDIYAMLDAIDSDDEEDIENLMNDSDTEFIDQSTIENGDLESDQSTTTNNIEIEDNVISTETPIEAVVRVADTDSEDENVPLSTLAVPKSKKEWKWRKQFRKVNVEKCKFTEKGIVNIDIEGPSPMQVFSKTVGLDGMLLLIKTESERYADQSGRMFQTSVEELRAFLGINILMGIHKLPKMRDYWSVDEGLGNPLIQKAMTRDRFLDILQNLHFADNLQQLPPKESEKYDRAWKLRPLFVHLLKHFQDTLQQESYQSVDEHMCKFKGKSLMRQYMKNKPIKWGFKFWFRCGSKSGYLYDFDMYLGKKKSTEFGLGESVVLSLCKSLENSHCHVFFDNFFTSPTLMLKLSEKGIYATGTVRSNRKHLPPLKPEKQRLSLKADKQMKRGEHDWLACDSISATKWMDNKAVILLSNYHDPRDVYQIQRRVKGSKDKMQVSCPTVIHEYNQYMGGVDLSDQMKVYYQVDRRSKFRFYLRVFFDFLDIGVVNSKIVYDKIESAVKMSSMDFRFSLARSMIRNFCNRKRALPTSRP